MWDGAWRLRGAAAAVLLWRQRRCCRIVARGALLPLQLTACLSSPLPPPQEKLAAYTALQEQLEGLLQVCTCP